MTHWGDWERLRGVQGRGRFGERRLPLGRRSLGLAGSLALLLIGLNLWLVA
jgi:hypothetical protein